MEKIPDRDNLNRAFKGVRANKGAPGVGGMTVEGALRYFRENREEIAARIYKGKYTPSPVRRAEIPKPNGGVRKLGIPTVADRTLRQAIARQVELICEPLFSDGSCGCRPGRSARQTVLKVKEYAEQGYTCAVDLDPEKYFDTINHNILLKLLREQIEDERVVQLVMRYLKSGVMEDGAVVETEEGSPQGGPLSPLLANICLNEFDKEYSKRGSAVCPVCGRHSNPCKEQTGRRAAAGGKYPVSGGETEIYGKPGEESGCQRGLSLKF